MCLKYSRSERIMVLVLGDIHRIYVQYALYMCGEEYLIGLAICTLDEVVYDLGV